MTKGTWNPKVKRRGRVHGFRTRMRSRTGRNVIHRRRLKGRAKLSV